MSEDLDTDRRKVLFLGDRPSTVGWVSQITLILSVLRVPESPGVRRQQVPTVSEKVFSVKVSTLSGKLPRVKSRTRSYQFHSLDTRV